MSSYRANNSNGNGFPAVEAPEKKPSHASTMMTSLYADDDDGSGGGGSTGSFPSRSQEAIIMSKKKKNKAGFFARRENILVVATVTAVFLGTALGIALRHHLLQDGAVVEPRTVSLIAFPGEILMHMLKMIVIPLIVSSLIAGLARLDARQSGRIGSLTIAYYMSTTVIAVVTGVILVLLVQPGSLPQKSTVAVVPATVGPQQRYRNAQPSAAPAVQRPGALPPSRPRRVAADTLDAMLDLARNAFPENVVQAALQHQQTTYPQQQLANGSTAASAKPVVVYKDGMNIIGLIVFSIAFGIVLGQLGEAGRPLVDFFGAFEQVIMRMVKAIMWFSPVGICSLIAGKILELEDVAGTVQSLALFTGTVVGGQAFHLLVSLPLIYFLLTRDNPYRFMRALIQAWTTALGTASSAATLPVTYACMEKGLGIDRRVTRFVLPVGATINMDGTALYEAVAAIFIASMNGMQLSIGQVLTVSLTATLASIGAASIPHGGFVMLVLVLSAIGLPAQDVSLVVAVDWFIDRFRTAVNVLGDAFGAGIVHHFTKDQLMRSDRDAEARQPIIRDAASPAKQQAVIVGLDHDGSNNRKPSAGGVTWQPPPRPPPQYRASGYVLVPTGNTDGGRRDYRHVA